MFSSLFSDAWTTHADELEYSNGQCMFNTIVKQAIIKVSNVEVHGSHMLTNLNTPMDNVCSTPL